MASKIPPKSIADMTKADHRRVLFGMLRDARKDPTHDDTKFIAELKQMVENHFHVAKYWSEATGDPQSCLVSALACYGLACFLDDIARSDAVETN